MKWRFWTIVPLLFMVAVSTVHARSPQKSGAKAQGSKQVAPASGKELANRKGLSGRASYYANRFHGRKTASGHLYYKTAMTAAHRSLPLGTWVRVLNEENGRYVVVQVTDRGPYVKGRVIDLSLAAAEDLGMLKKGTVPVSLEVLGGVEVTHAMLLALGENSSSPFGSRALVD